MKPTEGFCLGKKASLTQWDEHDSLSSLFTQIIYNDFLSCVTYYIPIGKL